MKIGCPLIPFNNMVISFFMSTKATVQYNESCSCSHRQKWSKTEICPCLNHLWIFFSMLLKQAFHVTVEEIFLTQRLMKVFFNAAHLKATSKLKKPDNVGSVVHPATYRFSFSACTDFGIKIS